MQPVALVTGAAGGIGRAIVKCFASTGWYVVGVDKETCSDVSGLSRSVNADIALSNMPAEIVRDLEANEQRLDALVNNAGIHVRKPLVETADADWDMTMATNARAAFLFGREASRLLRANEGAVVNISSVHALATSEGNAAYSASKGALVALTRVMALEFGRWNVRANVVLPGAVSTPMLLASLQQESPGGQPVAGLMAAIGGKHALGRVGLPEEVASVVHFLADATKAAFITGQAIVVDGGAIARLSTE